VDISGIQNKQANKATRLWTAMYV